MEAFVIRPQKGKIISHPARWWSLEEDGKIRCELCPRLCRIGEGQAGFCTIRQNHGGKLVSLGYGRPTGFGVDPIEKKPLFHFYPGTQILSFGTVGCNLGCQFCQNWDMSKAKTENHRAIEVTPEKVVGLALQELCPGIAYTYNDPVIFGEFVVDVSKCAHEKNIKNVMVTAGYIEPKAREEVFHYIDAANVDLKSFSEEFYFKLTLSHLKPVLDTLEWLHRETEVWIEITTLLIPGRNDSDDEIRREAEWILKHVGDAVPLHLTAFHPAYRMTDIPRTPADTLLRARALARKAGLKFVYVGNILDTEGSTTYCPSCQEVLIERNWHTISEFRLIEDRCPACGLKVPGRFDAAGIPRKG
ncbi:MAG: AmmeMemoRadiSam system radical SAM enzyme [Candidatus Eisenbacteria bacterium]|uniref:AmmeMemoRadiSam system radical SAM enzyme n=1 Tax=Eiseniibacteriota bacterium TaxID=2212470 RepID=A0A948RY41_UNCEI|nr:AmmeMemoRadiSam system radical SAM enzyme [Candidatus Eisenbacteria bacterium]MBU1947503.1 AmmeMemoRadiSam system radical SAM enzyme [Candidatus Eisenbacteria bacterium]MBU2691724.1 AmmeMemoRadiSam system radical SAM enzyme [Candidatus Eisenbacteria bacterium]